MILIADSGSTKTDWRLIDNNKIIELSSIGINPYFINEKIVDVALRSTFDEEMLSNISEVYFYGAGCSTKEACTLLKNIFQKYFVNAVINIEHDLLAAARATCFNREGIVAILGTGSNTCYYNGENIDQNIESLGYILGDEGSGSFMGKLLLRKIYREEVDHDIIDDFNNTFKLNKDTLFNRLYKEPLPNKFLASFTPFISKHIHHPEMQWIVYKSFEELCLNCLSKYKKVKELPVHFVGSIAQVFVKQLNEILHKHHYTLGDVIKQPINNLVKYHTGQF